MMTRLFSAIFLLICVLANNAQAETKPPVRQQLAEWNAAIEDAAGRLESPDLDDETLKRLRGRLTEIRDAARAVQAEIDLEAAPLRDELDALGPPPAEAEPKESPAIARKRQSLNDGLAAVEGQVKETELTLSRADKALKQLSALRIGRFTQRVFSRGLSAASPEVWRKAIPELRDKLTGIKTQFESWRAQDDFVPAVRLASFHLAVALLSALAIVWPLSRWFSRRFGRIPEKEAPSYVELFRAALVVAFVRILLPATAAVAVYWVLRHDLGWTQPTREIAFSLLSAFLMAVSTAAVSRGMVSPYGGRWRLMPLEDADARYIHRVIVGLAYVFAVDLVLEVWLAGAGASLELTVLRKFGIGLAIAGLLLALVVRGSLWRTDVDHRRRKTGRSALWRGFRNLIAVLVLLIPVSAIAGYVAFSRLLGTQIVLTGGLYILVNAVNALCTELIDELLNKETLIGSEIRLNLELTDDGAELMAFWIKAAVYVVVYLGAFLTLLVIWGAGGEDLSEWLYTALFGFKVAGVTVSIATLFLAVALFSGVLVLTRLFQRFLERRILPRTRLDYGVQHSIRASVGYAGFIVAAMFAVSTLGIDMTKLAIIAGALSVGIGFGLQNVVNNFVSGLILLIERPIKVGDLVVVGDKQGYVKKIKVRATEILTFDRASVFIPNSELISQSLLNKTHADKIGRVILPVGVAYGADTQKVRDILLALASAHPDVLKNPAPSLLFKGFGDSCLDFELRAFLGDVDKVATVGSDLCFEIDAAFRKENIEIPFPQQDVHWRDMARLESLVDKILAERKK